MLIPFTICNKSCPCSSGTNSRCKKLAWSLANSNLTHTCCIFLPCQWDPRGCSSTFPNHQFLHPLSSLIKLVNWCSYGFVPQITWGEISSVFDLRPSEIVISRWIIPWSLSKPSLDLKHCERHTENHWICGYKSTSLWVTGSFKSIPTNSTFFTHSNHKCCVKTGLHVILWGKLCGQFNSGTNFQMDIYF